MRSWVMVCVLMGTSAVSLAAPCNTQQERAAIDEAGSLKSWAALHKSFVKFGHCDDGAIAEGYSESVTNLLAEHWESLPELARLADRDNGFSRFVLRHINETVPPERLERIANNAQKRCPKRLSTLCGQIARSARA